MILNSVAVCICTLSFALGIYSLLVITKFPPLKYISFVSFSFSIWSFGAIFFNSGPTSLLRMWYNVSCTGWISLVITVPAFLFSFPNVSINLGQKFPKFLKLFFGIFTVILTVFQWTTSIFAKDFVRTQYGTLEIIGKNSYGALFAYTAIVFITILSISILISEKQSNKTAKFRLLFNHLLVSIISLAIVYVIVRIIPRTSQYFGKKYPYFLWTSYILFFPIQMILIFQARKTSYAQKRLLTFLSDLIPDMLLAIFDPNLSIMVNQKFHEYFSVPQGMTLVEFITKYPQSNKFFEKFSTANDNDTEKMVELITEKNEKVLVDTTVHLIKDEYNDILAKVFIFKQMYDHDRIMNNLKLSPQEKKVVLLIARGNGNKEIATEMDLSENTVRNYLTNIYQKTSVSSRLELVQLIFKNN